jgi:hypothetical protein
MSYQRLEKMRERTKLENAEKEARKELADALREIRDTAIPDIIGCGISIQLVIGAKEHRDAIGKLLERFGERSATVNEENLQPLAEYVVAKIAAYEAAKKAIKDFDEADDHEAA